MSVDKVPDSEADAEVFSFKETFRVPANEFLSFALAAVHGPEWLDSELRALRLDFLYKLQVLRGLVAANEESDPFRGCEWIIRQIDEAAGKVEMVLLDDRRVTQAPIQWETNERLVGEAPTWWQVEFPDGSSRGYQFAPGQAMGVQEAERRREAKRTALTALDQWIAYMVATYRIGAAEVGTAGGQLGQRNEADSTVTPSSAAVEQQQHGTGKKNNGGREPYMHIISEAWHKVMDRHPGLKPMDALPRLYQRLKPMKDDDVQKWLKMPKPRQLQSLNRHKSKSKSKQSNQSNEPRVS